MQPLPNEIMELLPIMKEAVQTTSLFNETDSEPESTTTTELPTRIPHQLSRSNKGNRLQDILEKVKGTERHIE